MNLYQFMLEIGANFRLDWDHHKQKWRASIPGAAYVLAASKSSSTDGTEVTVNYFATTFHPFRVHRAVAIDAIAVFVNRIRGAKLRRGGTVCLVPLDLDLPSLASFPDLSKPETKEQGVFYESSPGNFMHVETVPVVTPDYPESIPFPFKKQYKAQPQPQPPQQTEPAPKPKRVKKLDPFF
jgi:hypothetical protein